MKKFYEVISPDTDETDVSSKSSWKKSKSSTRAENI